MNNIEDVHRVEALLRESLSIEAEPIERQDYISGPTDHGYRALHINFRVNAPEHFGYDLVRCEVQIRTRLQDSWAELSHEDIYKQEDLPADLRARFSDLATVLAAADQIAAQIRERVRRLSIPPAEQPRLDRVDDPEATEVSERIQQAIISSGVDPGGISDSSRAVPTTCRGTTDQASERCKLSVLTRIRIFRARPSASGVTETGSIRPPSLRPLRHAHRTTATPVASQHFGPYG